MDLEICEQTKRKVQNKLKSKVIFKGKHEIIKLEQEDKNRKQFDAGEKHQNCTETCRIRRMSVQIR